ncbi:MAG: type III-A CRISPR-associated RAMP protein Csm5 [Ignavibacteria bacterium]|jgi:CRISPR-associated protein Csm5|nr:type III-A CRISPR-associated RAMP protein Csm5 [Ignavibacteria bacterium]MCU7504467.1 type III-A CRISPR-associated RAMP protein Csm5 [Ignavibacteria bacterium]MCU7517954.1 type III-A CRISPR-associated RAMP protein Csm5 [Ignavibacteria bacterium]
MFENNLPEAKRKLGAKIICSIELLSPVHIGSGIKLSRGLDFLSENSSTIIISPSILMDYLRSDREELENFISGGYKLQMLKHLPEGRKYNVKCNSSDILQFERNGNSLPYLPGSSIKGALRTILFKCFLMGMDKEDRCRLLESINPKNKESADKEITKKIFGNLPNNNFMRILQIGDAMFEEGSMELFKIYIMNMTDSSKPCFAWKNVRRKLNTLSPNDATPVHAEMLQAGSAANFSIKIENFLFENPQAIAELGFASRKLTIENLSEEVNRYSREMLESELKFFQSFKNPLLRHLEAELARIMETIPPENSEQSKKEMVLRLGWGTGWKSMTGNWIDEQSLKIIRPDMQLGRAGMPFPKTRKIIFEDNEPAQVPGWVKIRLNSAIKEESVKQATVQEEDVFKKLSANFRVTLQRK